MATKGGSSSQITGYKYFMSVHMGIGRGPINELTEIRIGDLTAFYGSIIVSAFQDIDKPDLFGGDQKEGGIVGTFKLFMGESTQTIDTVITDEIEGGFPVPGWRGVTTLFYYGQIAVNNPYPKPWKMRVNRQTAGWDGDVWESSLALITMQSNPLTLVSFTSNPNSGDSITIGNVVVGFFTVASGLHVNIGTDAEDTAGNFAGVLNGNSEDFFDVVATVNGIQVTLVFPSSTLVQETYGDFVSITQQGGDIKAMNPAHIIYECATNNVWGRGLPRTLINESSFLAAAQQLYSEGFGLCLRWNRQEDIDKFVGVVISHIGAALYIDRRTGLLTLNLIRDNYDPDSLGAYTFENGILDIIEDQSSSNDTIYNEIIVSFIDPISGQKGAVRAQNLASFQSLGTLISTNVDYTGAPTASLAARLAQRDLQVNSSNLRRMTIKMGRTGWNIRPGGVFKINVPTRGIENTVLRVGNIEDGPLDDETINISAVQDVFSLPSASFVAPQPSYWVPTDRSARVIDQRLVDEMTYYDISENVAELNLLTADTGVIKIFAEQPSGATIDYIVQSKTTTETGFVDRNIAGFDAGAELAAGLSLHETTGEFESGKFLNLVAVGQPILLVGADVQEYCELTAVDTTLGTMTIVRGCIDTIPHVFVAGDKVWFQTNMPTSDFRDYATSEIVEVRLLSRTSSARLDPSLADIDEVEIGGRQGRPYPPGNLDIDGIAFEASQVVDGDVIFTWAHRDRITQGNFLLGHTEGSTGPEAGTTYTFRVYDGVSLLRTQSGLTGTTWTYTAAMAATDGSLPQYRFELESVRDGLVSWQKYDFSVLRSPSFDTGFDYNFDGAP